MSNSKRIKEVGKKQIMHGARVRGRIKRRKERRVQKAVVTEVAE